MNFKKRCNSVILIFLTILGSYIFGQNGLFNSGSSGPYVDAGEDIESLPGSIIYLDGSESYLNDGSRINYTWIFSLGLVLNEDNNFGSDYTIETYDPKYLKSIQTKNDVLQVKIASNDPGVRLEVFLEIKNRLGFEASDTLIVEYLSPVSVDSSSEMDRLNIPDSLFTKSKSDSTSIMTLEGDSTSIMTLEGDSTKSSDLKFYKGIAFLDKLKFENSKWTAYAKYPFIAGGVYLFLDILFFNNSDDSKPEKPPGFPHDT